VVHDQIVVSWDGNKLICPISDSPKPLAELTGHNELVYRASFLVQLDGQVAYSPSTNGSSGIDSHYSYIILVENPIAEQQAVRFSSHQTVVVDPLVKHSMPIPLPTPDCTTFEFTVHHRSVNAVLQLEADPAGPHPIVVNLNKVDRINEVAVRLVNPLGPKVGWSLKPRNLK